MHAKQSNQIMPTDYKFQLFLRDMHHCNWYSIINSGCISVIYNWQNSIIMLSGAGYTRSWFVLVSPVQLVSSQMVLTAPHDPYMLLLCGTNSTCKYVTDSLVNTTLINLIDKQPLMAAVSN